MKICKVCGQEYEGRSNFCSKKCRDKDYNHRYYLKNIERKKERDSVRAEKKRKEKEQYYLEHKEEIEAEKKKIEEERAVRKKEYAKEYAKKIEKELMHEQEKNIKKIQKKKCFDKKMD